MFELFFGSLSSLFWAAVLVGVILYYNRKPQTPSRLPGAAPEAGGAQGNAQRDKAWRHYLANFKHRKLTADQQELLGEILTGAAAPDMLDLGGYVDPLEVQAGLKGGHVAAHGAQLTAASAAHPTVVTSGMAGVPDSIAPAAYDEQPGAGDEQTGTGGPKSNIAGLQQDIDNTSLLLYFGAFLFVASAGLFVAFGGISGGLRTLTVFLTMAVMYYVGFNLYDRSVKLRPAGVAFTAIGMAIAPLTGVAAYYFVADETSGKLIWLLNSGLCLALYGYALTRMKYSFISYLFIFSFLSLFESAVAITSVPTYFYIWGLIAAGMLLRITGFVHDSEDLRAPAAVSAQLVVPLSLLVSLVVVGTQGIAQLSISLLLAAVYYTIEAREPGRNRESFAAGAHMLYLAGITLAAYALWPTGHAVTYTLLGLVALQAGAIMMLPPKHVLSVNFASVALVSLLPAIFFAFPNGTLMAAGFGAGALLGALIAVRQHRHDALAAGAVAWIALPLAVGQIAVRPGLDAAPQAMLSFVPVLTLWVLWGWLAKRGSGPQWRAAAADAYVIAGLLATGIAAIEGGWYGLAAAAVFATTLAVAARLGAGTTWWAAAGVIASLPIIREIYLPESTYFAIATLFALVANIVITLSSRQEFNRWLVALVGLLLPFALGKGGLGFTFDGRGYAYSYLVVMAGLIYCRALARGVYLASSKRTILSFYRTASMSYVWGYIAAAALALLISLDLPSSPLHTSVILAVVTVTTAYLAIKVEKQPRLLVLVPWMLVLLLVSAVRPPATDVIGSAVVIGASVFSVFAFAWFEQKQRYFGDAYEEVMQGVLALSFMPVGMCLWYETALLVPALVLAIAGLQTVYYTRGRQQSERELSAAIVVAAVMLALYELGVRNLQAYTHIAAMTCAAYAYWRYLKGDILNSDNYLKWMFWVATVPLALQALGGKSGDGYGWWLILEQVGFMILGIYTKRKFITLWGLYVALAAVLYQLRNLGWAALTVLAVFVIGMAIYRLQRGGDHTGKQ